MSEAAQQADAALEQVQAAWNAAALHWRVDAFADLYAEDAVFLGGRPGHSVGRDAVRDYFASYVGIIESATLTLTGQQLRALADGVVLAQGHGEFSFLLAGGKPTRNLMRTTLVLVLRGGRWQILQHHFSEVPVTPPLGEG